MIRKLAIGLFLLITLAVAVVLGLALLQPNEYRVERGEVVRAAPAVVHGLVNDLHRFPEWSPWQDLDPGMRVEHSGAPAGVGASYHWVGNDQVGEGRMTIRSSVPDREVVMDLEFLKPFESSSELTFTFVPVRGGTRVVWTMSGSNNFMGKAMSVFMSMDRAIGRDFERGLARLKDLAERATAPVDTPVDTAVDTTAAPVAPAEDSTEALLDTPAH